MVSSTKGEAESRFYKMSIHIGPFRYCQNSKVYDIKANKSRILPGLKYSLVTILLGWWGFSLRNPFRAMKTSLEALHINFSGGEDISNLVDEQDYDELTNYVWRNLLRSTTDKLTKKELEIVLEIQVEYASSENSLYTKENVDYIMDNLGKLQIYHVDISDVEDVFDALKLFSKEEV